MYDVQVRAWRIKITPTGLEVQLMSSRHIKIKQVEIQYKP